MGAHFSHTCFVMRLFFALTSFLLVAGNALAQSASAETPLNLGIIADTDTREIEDCLLVKLQAEPTFRFLERMQFSKVISEFSVQDLLTRGRWESCDVLILLNAFSTSNESKERLLIVRFISTHTLQTMGLWVYPLGGADIPTLAGMVGDRIKPALTREGVFAGRKAVSISFLRAETPALTAWSNSATFLLGEQVQNQSALSLVERWNVRDPSFEQWLRQTMPANVKGPDLFVEGSLTEVNSKPGLRLSINGELKSFDARTGAPTLKEAAEQAAAAIARAAGAPMAKSSPAATEFSRFEKDARWFWKWAWFREAAASADTAVLLGSTARETRYIQALASIHSRRNHEYVSNLAYADTPSVDDLRIVIYGLERFLEIPTPSTAASWPDRVRHLGYSEDAIQWAGQLLQGLYFSQEELPGTEEERGLLRTLTWSLITRTLAYSKNLKWERLYPAHLEHVGNILSGRLPGLLTSYACFAAKDPEDLIPLYVAAFEAAAREGASERNNSLPQDLFDRRLYYSHNPWVVNWDHHAPDDLFFRKFVTVLTGHPKPEVRILAYLMPAGYPPLLPLAKVRAAQVSWVRWAIGKLEKESAFLAGNPNKYSFQLLGCVGSLMGEMRSTLKGTFPEEAWRKCVSTWMAAFAPDQDAYSDHTKRYLDYLMRTSLQNKAVQKVEIPAPSDAEIADLYRLFALAPPPADTKTREIETAKVRELNQKRQTEPKTSPTPPLVTMTSSPNPLPRGPWDNGVNAVSDSRLRPELMFVGLHLGKPISMARSETGSLWFMFWDNDREEKTLRLFETDAGLKNILRTVTIQNFPGYAYGWERSIMMVRGDSISWVMYQRLYKVRLGTNELESLSLPKMTNFHLWETGDRAWVTGAPGLIYEYFPAEHRLQLISSSMRVPATNLLDGKNEYNPTYMFSHDGLVYVWINGILYVRDEAVKDWRKIYTSIASGFPVRNQYYPRDIIFRSLGDGREVSAQSGLLDVLSFDAGFGGILRSSIMKYPIKVQVPGNDVESWDNILSISATANGLWVVFWGPDSEPNLGLWQYRTGARFSYPLRFPKLYRPHSFYILDDGFLFEDQRDNLYYLQRSRLTVAK